MGKKLFLHLPLVIALAAGSAWAAEPAVTGSTATPQMREYQGVPYVTGGVGDSELATLKQMSGQFNLELTFALASGQFLSDADVRVQDAHGNTVLQAVADGPMLYAKLPPGTYRVTASSSGRELTHTVTVHGNGLARANFLWP